MFLGLYAYSINYDICLEEYLEYPITRSGQHLAYHSSSSDYIFYGTHKWAVKFVVNDIVTQSNLDPFLCSGFLLYFPQPYNNVNIYLQHNHNCEDNNYSCFLSSKCAYDGQPLGNILFSEFSVNVSHGWNNFSLLNEVALHNVWVIVESANLSEINLSASKGSGINSYYWDKYPIPQNQNAGSFKSLGLNGFRADFLFSLIGSFVNPIMIIDIIDFKNPYSINLVDGYLPSFTIVNNSPIQAKNVYANIILSNSISDSFTVPHYLNIREEFTNSFNISLPLNEYTQYDVLFEVGCEPQDYTLIKKSRISRINIFPNEKLKPLLNVFAFTGYQSTIDFIREYASFTSNDSIDIFFCFANSLDPLYTLAARQLNNRYNITGYEHTFFNGGLKISNFNNFDFLTKQRQNFLLARTDKTFLKEDILFYKVENENLNLSLEFSNTNTNIINPLQNTMFLHAVFLQPRILDNYGNLFTIPNVISQYITNPIIGFEMRNLSQINNKDIFNISIPLYTILLIDDNDYGDLSILYWIEDKEKKIHIHNLTPLKDLEFPDIKKPHNKQNSTVKFFPNPLKIGNIIQVQYSNSHKQKDEKVTIYNLKGQRLVSKKISDTFFSLDEVEIKSTGIYFIQIKWKEDGLNYNTINKIMIMK